MPVARDPAIDLLDLSPGVILLLLGELIPRLCQAFFQHQ
jgi:hypothetical protein